MTNNHDHRDNRDDNDQVLEARARGSVLDLCGGFMCLVLGGITAAGIWLLSAPTEGFIITWSVTGIGIFHILRGMHRVTTNWY